MKLFDLNHLIASRHWFHANAELSLKEVNTSSRIIEELKRLKIPVKDISIKATTGVQVDIAGQGPPCLSPRTICLRADIDALPIIECNPNISIHIFV